MIGLLPNHHRVARLVGISASTGWFRGMRLGFRLKARLGLRCLVPLGTLVKGYAPTSAVGLGEDLPAGVARQWGQWCAAGGYATKWSRDLKEVSTSNLKSPSVISIETPGTPVIGRQFLRAWKLTGDPLYLQGAREAAQAEVVCPAFQHRDFDIFQLDQWR